MRSLLTRVQLSVLALALTGTYFVGCGDDPAPAPVPPPGDGDGDGDDNGDGDGDDNGDGDGDDNGDGDGDGDGDDEACQTGSTQACECEDGESEGMQYCLNGEYTGPCMGCPCTDGDSQPCQLASCQGGLGTQVCEDGDYGTCECDEDTQNDMGCPEGTTCMPFTNPLGGGGGGGALNMCIANGAALPIPPECTTDDDCTEAGFVNVKCQTNPFAFPPISPEKVCLKGCTPGGGGGDGDSDAGT